MSWLKNKVFKKEFKVPVDGYGAFVKNLNEKTTKEENDRKLENAFNSQFAALNQRDSVNAMNKKRETFLAYQRAKMMNSDNDNDSDDIKLPSIGGEEDFYRRPQYVNDTPPNDRLRSNGPNDNNSRRNNEQPSSNGQSSGQQQSSSAMPKRPYPPLQFIDLPLPRK